MDTPALDRVVATARKLVGSLRGENAPSGSPVAELRDALAAWDEVCQRPLAACIKRDYHEFTNDVCVCGERDE